MKYKITVYFYDRTVEQYIVEYSPFYKSGFFNITLTDTNWLSIPSHMIQYIEGEVIE